MASSREETPVRTFTTTIPGLHAFTSFEYLAADNHAEHRVCNALENAL